MSLYDNDLSFVEPCACVPANVFFKLVFIEDLHDYVDERK